MEEEKNNNNRQLCGLKAWSRCCRVASLGKNAQLFLVYPNATVTTVHICVASNTIEHCKVCFT